MMLFTSSCMMKNMLWDYFGMERAMPAKALASTQENQMESSDALLILCAADSNNLPDSTAVVAASNTSLILFLGFFIAISWIFSGIYRAKEQAYTSFNYATSGTVPLYLKLGRLILYS